MANKVAGSLNWCSSAYPCCMGLRPPISCISCVFASVFTTPGCFLLAQFSVVVIFRRVCFWPGHFNTILSKRNCYMNGSTSSEYRNRNYSNKWSQTSIPAHRHDVCVGAARCVILATFLALGRDHTLVVPSLGHLTSSEFAVSRQEGRVHSLDPKKVPLQSRVLLTMLRENSEKSVFATSPL